MSWGHLQNKLFCDWHFPLQPIFEAVLPQKLKFDHFWHLWARKPDSILVLQEFWWSQLLFVSTRAFFRVMDTLSWKQYLRVILDKNWFRANFDTLWPPVTGPKIVLSKNWPKPLFSVFLRRNFFSKATFGLHQFFRPILAKTCFLTPLCPLNGFKISPVWNLSKTSFTRLEKTYLFCHRHFLIRSQFKANKGQKGHFSKFWTYLDIRYWPKN